MPKNAPLTEPFLNWKRITAKDYKIFFIQPLAAPFNGGIQAPYIYTHTYNTNPSESNVSKLLSPVKSQEHWRVFADFRVACWNHPEYPDIIAKDNLLEMWAVMRHRRGKVEYGDKEFTHWQTGSLKTVSGLLPQIFNAKPMTDMFANMSERLTGHVKTRKCYCALAQT